MVGHVEKMSEIIAQLVEEAAGEQYRCSCGLYGPKVPKLKLKEAADVAAILMKSVKQPAEAATIISIQSTWWRVVRLCPTGGSKADEGLRFSTGVWRSEPRRHGGVKCWATLNRRYWPLR